MLSRVETIEQLFILGHLPENKFYANHQALEELARLENVSVNRNPPVWQQTFPWSFKISQLNCRSLNLHIQEIKNDYILAFSDAMCLNETWLENNMNAENLKIAGFELHLNSNGLGKGIGTYFKSQKMNPEKDITKPKAQITLLSSPELVNIYRSQH